MLCMCSLYNYSTNMPNSIILTTKKLLDPLIYFTLSANVPGNLKTKWQWFHICRKIHSIFLSTDRILKFTHKLLYSYYSE